MIERRCGHRCRRQRRLHGESRRRAWRPASLIFAAILAACSVTPAAAAPASAPVAKPEVAQIGDSLRALDRLHQMGYSIDSAARADRAIRHWQRANGLTVDGVVGSATLASLGLARGATATVPAVRATSSPEPVADVEQIIRQAWPDELEDRALQIAHRESRLVPTARNSCCWGLFQIHWGAHHSWLAELGITTPTQLLDAATNARAAYALYQRDGWQPWVL